MNKIRISTKRKCTKDQKEGLELKNVITEEFTVGVQEQI